MKLSIFESAEGYTTTARGMIPLVAACVVAALALMPWPGNLWFLPGLAGIVAGCLGLWWVANVVHIILAQNIERARLRAEARPMAVQVRLHSEQITAQARLIEAVRGMDAQAVLLARELHAFPDVKIRAGAPGYGGVGIFLSLDGLEIPGAFCARWMEAYNVQHDGSLPPVRTWSGNERQFAEQITDALVRRGVAVIAAGNQSARWVAPFPVASRWAALLDIGVPLAAHYYQTDLSMDEQNDN